MNGVRPSRTRLLTLLSVALIVLAVRPSSASCVPPEVTVDRTRVTPGERVEISGTGWAATCPGPRDEGCGGDDRPTASPVAGIRVTLVPVGNAGAREVELVTVDAHDDYTFRVEGVVPAGLAPGRYRLEAHGGDHAGEPAVTIVVRKPSS